jgi:hypothetical protein
VILVDGTFLTEKYKDTLMMAAAVDLEDQIVPMTFALVEGENNSSWSWFMRILRTQVFGASCTICLISDRHAGILHAADEDIEGFPSLVHRCACVILQLIFGNVRGRRRLVTWLRLYVVCV